MDNFIEDFYEYKIAKKLNQYRLDDMNINFIYCQIWCLNLQSSSKVSPWPWGTVKDVRKVGGKNFSSNKKWYSVGRTSSLKCFANTVSFFYRS